MKRHGRPLVLSVVLILLGAEQAFATPCINWPALMSQHEVASFPKGKKILVQTFVRQGSSDGDEWLTSGLRDLLASMLKSGRQLRIYAGLTASHGEAATPDITIGGSFQTGQGRIKIFIATKNAQGELLRQQALSIPYPHHRDFFLQVSDAVMEIFKLLGASYDEDRLEKVRTATSSTQCYEHYARGRAALESYAPAQMEVASTWFHEAIHADYRSPLGYQGLVDVATFRGISLKQDHKPFGSSFQQAEEHLTKMVSLVRSDPSVPSLKKPKWVKKAGEPKVPFDNRFLQGHAFYMRALSALQTAKLYEAAEALEASVQLVPEDAVAWTELADVYTRLMKRSKAAEARSRARAVNSCLGQDS